MRRKTQNAAKPFRSAVLGLLAVAALFVPATAANARPPAADTVIELPGASGAEGIAAGHGTTFYAGDLPDGDIYRGDVRTGTAALFIDVPDGRAAVGMKVDLVHDLLFVAGGATGQGYVYDINAGTTVAVYQLTAPGTFINDVTINDQGAWFTNSGIGELYLIPITAPGELGDVEQFPPSSP